MDSITQFALGAAIGEATLGKKAKVRAALVGGVVASLPDLDVFYPFANQVSAFTWHRGITHSLLVLALAAPLVAWLLNKTRITSKGTARQWRLLVFLALLTHPLLDAFTVYGTQLLWPIPMPPVTWSTLFIIDPIATLVLILGVVGARLADRRGKDSSTRIGTAALCLMVTYVVWSIGARLQVDRVAHQYLETRGSEVERLISTPLPFGTLGWRILAMVPGGYYEGTYRIGHPDSIRFSYFPSRPELLEGLPAEQDIARLAWFSKGFYGVRLEEDRIIYSDLRMGIEPDYVFRFVVGPDLPQAQQLPVSFDPGRLFQAREMISD